MNKVALQLVCLGLCGWLLLVWAAHPARGAVDKRQIDGIRAKSVLSEDRDLPAIDEFVQGQFLSMMRAKTTADMDKPLGDLLDSTSSVSSVDNAVQVYSDRFAAAVQSAYQQAFEKSAELTDAALVHHLRLSAAMVVVRADNPLLLDDVLGLLSDRSPDVRYWAARGLSTPRMSAALVTAEDDDDLVRGLRAKVSAAVEAETSGAVMAQLARANRIMANPADGAALLNDCAQTRVAQYRAWTVQNEMADLMIMTEIFDLVSQNLFEDEPDTEAGLVLAAAELLSAAQYRYSVGTGYAVSEDKTLVLLTPESQEELRTLLVEGELGLYRLSGSNANSLFLRRMQQNDSLKPAYDALLGVNGAVNRQFDIFPEGTADNPLQPLPDPPTALVERAEIMAQLPEKLLEVE